MLLNGWSSNGPWLRKVWIITRGFIPNYLSSTVLDRICPRERRAQPLQVERWGTVLEIHGASTDFLGRCQTISSLGNFGSGIFVMEASLFLYHRCSELWAMVLALSENGGFYSNSWQTMGTFTRNHRVSFSFSPKKETNLSTAESSSEPKKRIHQVASTIHVCDRARQVTGRPSLATLAVGGGNPEMKPGKPGFYPQKGGFNQQILGM